MLKKLMPLVTYFILLGAMLCSEFMLLKSLLIIDESNSVGSFMGYVGVQNHALGISVIWQSEYGDYRESGVCRDQGRWLC